MTATDSDADIAGQDRGYPSFASWADAVLSDVPSEVCAFCFNLEETKHHWTIDLAGTTSLVAEDADWAVDPAFGPVGELRVGRQAELSDWPGMLALSHEWVQRYVADDRLGAQRLRTSMRVADGCGDGDLETVWPSRTR